MILALLVFKLQLASLLLLLYYVSSYCLLGHTKWGTTDIQSCPIKLPPLFRALAVWVVPV